MFIVAADLSEAQRERLTRSLSLRRTKITAYTVQAVRTTFLELFSTPKSSMENPSLRVSGHVSSMNRTFIVEDCAEDDFGQWATDEVTCEQGYIDDERLCFWTWESNECAWEKENTKVYPKEAEEPSLAKNKHKILKCVQRTQRQERLVKRQ